MKSEINITKQLESNWHLILLILGVASSFIGVIIFVRYWNGVPFGNLTRDPVGVLGGAIYIGFLSQTGIFFWSASATVCLFCSAIISSSPEVQKLKHFFISSGLLSLLLGVDDIFLLHERFFPYIGIDQKIILVSYAILTLIWLIRFQSIILKTDYILLGMAFVFFATSVIIDVINADIKGRILFEDGAKFVGIVSWMVYFFRVAFVSVHPKIAHQQTFSNE